MKTRGSAVEHPSGLAAPAVSLLREGAGRGASPAPAWHLCSSLRQTQQNTRGKTSYKVTSVKLRMKLPVVPCAVLSVWCSVGCFDVILPSSNMLVFTHTQVPSYSACPQCGWRAGMRQILQLTWTDTLRSHWHNLQLLS